MDALQADLENELYENNLCGFDVFVDLNPDNWRGGFQWSVSQGNKELECGLEFSRSMAFGAARKFIEKITQ